MLTLSSLKNFSRPNKKIQRVGRGAGSGRGKTCGRGNKGAGSRSGYKQRLTYEGGQFRLFRKLPCRGFTNGQFKKQFYVINLDQIQEWFEEGETVNELSLRDKRLVKGRIDGVKVLGNGELTKKVTIEAHGFSSSAKEKLEAAGVSYTVC